MGNDPVGDGYALTAASTDQLWAKQPKINPDANANGQTYGMPQLTITATPTAELRVRKGQYAKYQPYWSSNPFSNQQGYECEENACFVVELILSTDSGSALRQAIHN